VAAFEVDLSSYQWLTVGAKRRRLASLIGALETVQADVQFLRVGSRWDPRTYSREFVQELDAAPHRGARVRQATRYLARQASALDGVGGSRPRLFLLVSLREPQRDVASWMSETLSRGPADWRRQAREIVTGRDRRVLRRRELELVLCRAEEVGLRLSDFLMVRSVDGLALQWLVRRASVVASASRRSIAATLCAPWRSSATVRRCYVRSRPM